MHFDGNLNFLDLFLPRSLSSADRARAFLWLMYHYLEEPSAPSPFADSFSMANLGKAPLVRKISKAEKARENVDTREEIEWGQKMSGERHIFLQKLVSQTDMDKKPRAPYFISGNGYSTSKEPVHVGSVLPCVVQVGLIRVAAHHPCLSSGTDLPKERAPRMTARSCSTSQDKKPLLLLLLPPHQCHKRLCHRVP